MPHQLELWIGFVEVRPFDRVAYGASGAFTYILTWARDANEFRKKADTIVATLELYVVASRERSHSRIGVRGVPYRNR
jgi:hypothetical protein